MISWPPIGPYTRWVAETRLYSENVFNAATRTFSSSTSPDWLDRAKNVFEKPATRSTCKETNVCRLGYKSLPSGPICRTHQRRSPGRWWLHDLLRPLDSLQAPTVQQRSRLSLQQRHHTQLHQRVIAKPRSNHPTLHSHGHPLQSCFGIF